MNENDEYAGMAIGTGADGKEHAVGVYRSGQGWKLAGRTEIVTVQPARDEISAVLLRVAEAFDLSDVTFRADDSANTNGQVLTIS